jgi:hypothetical protein
VGVELRRNTTSAWPCPASALTASTTRLPTSLGAPNRAASPLPRRPVASACATLLIRGSPTRS